MLLLSLASDPLADASAKVVKLYGAGAGRVEAYSSGVLIGRDGKILTVLTGMLQGESVTAVFADGRRRPATLKAADPSSGLALLSTSGLTTPSFDLDKVRRPDAGEVVYALSNAFNVAAGDEPVTLQRGVIAGSGSLTGKVGVRESPTTGEVLLIDAAVSNPGAAGGALIDANGTLVGIVGRELRNAATNTWIHYAIPGPTLVRFLSGAPPANPPISAAPATVPKKADLRGLVPLPDWLDRTPPFIDSVEPNSPAAAAGLKSDDLVMFVDGKLVGSVAEMQSAFAARAPDRLLKLTVKRGAGLLTVELSGRMK